MALRIENALALRAMSVELSRLRSAVPEGTTLPGVVGKSRQT
jgi:hypothetical protein